jgi:hypothetical protein
MAKESLKEWANPLFLNLFLKLTGNNPLSEVKDV